MRPEYVRGASQPPTPQRRSDHAAVLESVARALEGIDYGSVLIKVHQGEVVSIETSVKQRLAPNR